MRLGKEQATGYVEDTEAGLPAREPTVAPADETAPTPAPEPSLPVS